MRIVCPSCQAAYDVPDAVIAAGRKLRCAKCSANFVPKAEGAAEPVVAVVEEAPPPPASAPPAALPVVPPPPPAAEKPAPAPAPASPTPLSDLERLVQAARQSEPQEEERGPVLAVAGAWIVSVLLVTGMVWGFLAYPATIMHAWPPSTRVYATLGYPIPGR